ncbi:HSF-type DNA-binding-domain-containing protein [Fusarium redolens]|uniref:Transcription factor n=1 Tax=Fusarium redolens TaxID=48865 RepID=A0A9P9K537_FUSRE|nr:HSF-type DNA-binding-domain-containing protein [Fusarium redolens]KAH7249702.1 HSF-type DNA-binding-domain-containing protein [Fusarium redolens]
MSGDGTSTPGVGGSNASEFVRKLYRMLEDPAHQDVARWGKDGDTFVVVENEKFTRSILPKHFKHSNMASFVRQLNKYDFHKVRQTNDSGSAANGANTLEFKHPNFRVGSKDDLDNIRRKAPAPRRTQATEDFTTSHHVSVMTEQLTATQQQVQQLQELFTEVSQTNRLLVNEVLTLQKMLNAQKQSQHEMLNFLSPSGNRHQQGMHLNVGTSPLDGSDDSAPELRRARELLSSVTPDQIADRELERLQGVYGSPADSAVVIPQASMPMMHDPMNDINRYPVYPVGQTVGIDPFHSDHIHKIPYAMPNESSANAMQEVPAPQPINIQTHSNSNSSTNSALTWASRKPRIFLVEDDPTCAKIGIKFLKSMGCEVEHAQNGADAYSRITSVARDHFDMIFMDIIMPKLDGVSTTMYIRQDCPAIPIVAMTSNIRSDEVHCYFEHGMNGVLAKPFTKSGMQKIVENHLSYLLKGYDPSTQQESGSGYVVGGAGYMNPPSNLNTPGGTTFKFETTPTPPATGATWSPGQMPQQSPMTAGMDQGYGMVNGANQYGLTPTSASRASFPTSISQTSQGRMDGQSPPEKRQRTYV